MRDTFLSMSVKSVGKQIVHLLLPIRKAQVRLVREFSRDVVESRVLEIGCGGKKDFIMFFENQNEVVQTDLEMFILTPDFQPQKGCKVYLWAVRCFSC